MMIKKEEKIKIYKKYLKRLYNKDYLTLARKGILSESGGKRYIHKLINEGYITIEKRKGNKKYVIFSKSGIKFLDNFGLLGVKNGGICWFI